MVIKSWKDEVGFILKTKTEHGKPSRNKLPIEIKGKLKPQNFHSRIKLQPKKFLVAKTTQLSAFKVLYKFLFELLDGLVEPFVVDYGVGEKKRSYLVKPLLIEGALGDQAGYLQTVLGHAIIYGAMA